MTQLSQLQEADTQGRKQVARTAVLAAGTSDEKKEVAAAALDALSAKERKDLIKSMWPTDSIDRRWVYIGGFIVAGVVALGLGLIAWGASSGDSGVETSVIILATGFSSAILGGLLGAYVQR